jgi:hypothetical protein
MYYRLNEIVCSQLKQPNIVLVSHLVVQQIFDKCIQHIHLSNSTYLFGDRYPFLNKQYWYLCSSFHNKNQCHTLCQTIQWSNYIWNYYMHHVQNIHSLNLQRYHSMEQYYNLNQSSCLYN